MDKTIKLASFSIFRNCYVSAYEGAAMSAQGFKYSVDLVLCIDATGSMKPVIEMVKSHALKFYDDLTAAMEAKQKFITDLRVRVIVYRDLHVDGGQAMIQSPFFKLPSEQAAFSAFVEPIKATGGGDEPESGLEALAHAMHSDWVKEGDKRRHVIVLWTDASAHPLEEAVAKATPGYPSDLPRSFGEITELWEGQETDQSAKRLLMYAPDAYPWTEIQAAWELAIQVISKAGQGLGEIDYSAVLEAIANSV